VQLVSSMPAKTDIVSVNSSPLLLSSDTDNISLHRPLSEPSAVTDVCINSDLQMVGCVELLKQSNAADSAEQVDLSAVVSSRVASSDRTVCETMGNKSYSVCVASSDRTVCETMGNKSYSVSSAVKDVCSEYASEVRRPCAVMLTESSVNNISALTSTVAVDEKSNYVPAVEGGSVWRKVQPHGGVRGVSEQDSVKSVSASEPRRNDAGLSLSVRSVAVDDVAVEHREQSVRADLNAQSTSISGIVDTIADNHINNVDMSCSDDKDAGCLLFPLAASDCDRHVHGDDSDGSHNETGYDLTDNNVVTAHQLRDDIPDSELIDYSDDGGESLIDSSASASVREQVHVFIALFDYDPATMSPNPDAIESELPFSEGQLIKVRSSVMHVLLISSVLA